jgi:hypothetical protein
MFSHAGISTKHPLDAEKQARKRYNGLANPSRARDYHIRPCPAMPSFLRASSNDVAGHRVEPMMRKTFLDPARPEVLSRV